LGNGYNQNECDNMYVLNINEIDISKFISDTNKEKKEIALLFDKTFHEYSIIRLINTNITFWIKQKNFFIKFGNKTEILCK